MEKDNRDELKLKLRRKIAEKRSARVSKREIVAYKKSNKSSSDVMDQVRMMVDDYNRNYRHNALMNGVQKKLKMRDDYPNLFKNYQPIFMAIVNGTITTNEDIKGIEAAFRYKEKMAKEQISLDQAREEISNILYKNYNHLLSDDIKKLAEKK